MAWFRYGVGVRVVASSVGRFRSSVSTRQSLAQPGDNDDQADAVEVPQQSRPGRTAYRRSAANPNGSTTALRSDVLGTLGVLKVATADQLQRLLRPGAASNKAIRQALGDLARHGLVASDGNTRDRHKTWRWRAPPGWTRPLRCSGWSARRWAARPGAPGAPVPSTRWRSTRRSPRSSWAAARPGPRAGWARCGPGRPRPSSRCRAANGRCAWTACGRPRRSGCRC